MPRNLILRYSNPGEWVLDQFMGSGTTLVEAKLLNRNAVGVDINPQSVSISETNLQFQCETNSKIFTRNGNATELHFIKDSHIDFICTHPPYANIIKYSKGIEGDISLLGVDEFLAEMCKVAEESYRVLKKGKMCAVMIGDVRKYGKIIPLGFRMMECFLRIKRLLLRSNIIAALQIIGRNRTIVFSYWHMSTYLCFKSKLIHKE